MRLLTILKYIGVLIFGYLLLLSLSYSYTDFAYQAIFTLLAGICIWFCINFISTLYNKYGATRVFWGIFFLGGMIRFSWALFVTTQPFSDFEYYYNNAMQLAQGNIVLTKNMGYSLLLSAWFRLYPSVLTGKLINAAASTLSILFLYHIGSRLINKKAGLIASFLFAVLPSEIIMVSVLGTEVVVTTLGVITAFFVICASCGKYSSSTLIFWAGLFYGLGLTVRSSFIFYFPTILIWAVFTAFPSYGKMGKVLLTFIVSTAIGLSIVPLCYYLSTKQLSLEPLKTQDSFPFLSGTNITTSGTWSQDDANLYFSWETDKRDALARQEALNRIKSNPIGFMLLIPKKIDILFGENNYGIYYSLKDIDWKIGKTLIGLFSQSIYVFILFFSFLSFRDSRNYRLLLVTLILVLSTLLPHTILEVQGRYHHYLMPFIVLLASNGIEEYKKTG